MTSYSFAVRLVSVVDAVAATITYLRRVQAHVFIALELTWQAAELRAVIRLVCAITAIVLSVTLPPEHDAFVRVWTFEVGR